MTDRQQANVRNMTQLEVYSKTRMTVAFLCNQQYTVTTLEKLNNDMKYSIINITLFGYLW
jgi:hypothetical protein